MSAASMPSVLSSPGWLRQQFAETRDDVARPVYYLTEVNGLQLAGFAGLLVEEVRDRRIDGVPFVEVTVWVGSTMVGLTLGETWVEFRTEVPSVSEVSAMDASVRPSVDGMGEIRDDPAGC